MTLRPSFVGGEFGYQTQVQVDGRGRYIVGPLVEPGTLAIYDSAASFIMRVRVGEPGSNKPANIESFDLAGADTIYVGDLKNRVYVLDSEGHQVRSFTAPLLSWHIAALDGRYAAVRRGVASDSSAPLVVVEATDAASTPQVFGPRGTRANRLRLIAADPVRGTLWTVSEFGDVVQEFGANGVLRATMDRQYEWISAPFDPRHPGQVVDIAPFHDGALVLVTRRVGEITRKDIIDPPDPAMPASLDPAAYQRTNNFYVDYASPTAAAKLYQHGSILTGVARGGVVYGIEEDVKTGEWVIQTWRTVVGAVGSKSM